MLQNLCAFYEVGEHNIIRLRGADWNDALDMAEQRGESVAFTCAYAGNLKQLAGYLKVMTEKIGCKEIEVQEGMQILFTDDAALYEDIRAKQDLLATYAASCAHNISEKKAALDVKTVIAGLYHKADWMMEHIRQNEWVNDEEGNEWFNSYYDNSGRVVEGKFEQSVRMMLTGQVFAIMSGTAKEDQVTAICKSADKYLYEKEIGGYRLNTDFHETKFDLGRMFGFAYGEKENGAVFSHMTVMYANALYQRGFVREGYKALQTLADTALRFEVSRMYPGIPEYFNGEGRGMYSYLTGAASWYMLTLITEVFGAKGELGNLILEPKLVKEQFDKDGVACVELEFAGKRLEIRYENPTGMDAGEYKISEVLSEVPAEICSDGKRAVLYGADVQKFSGQINRILVKLM